VVAALLIKPKKQHGKNQNKNTGLFINCMEFVVAQKAHVLTEVQKTARVQKCHQFLEWHAGDDIIFSDEKLFFYKRATNDWCILFCRGIIRKKNLL
jgi:hypothetical protein